MSQVELKVATNEPTDGVDCITRQEISHGEESDSADRPQNVGDPERATQDDRENAAGAADDDGVTQYWKMSSYAIGRTNPQWKDELLRGGSSCDNIHLKISGLVCGFIKAKRIGNMSILLQSKSDPPKLIVVAGPLWFITLTVTIPLILGISLAVYYMYLNCYDMWIRIVWGLSLVVLLVFLCITSLRDPGIALRHAEALQEDWTWNDQARTFRSPTSKFDPVCAVVVDGFDHVCPWVGTAVGSGNMYFFKKFVLMLAICVTLDVILIFLSQYGGNGRAC